MKRLFICLLAVILALPLAACSKKPEKDKGPITPIGTYEKGSEKFADLQSDLYNYFLHFYGFGHVETGTNGRYRDSDLVAFAMIQLSHEGVDIDQGVTHEQISTIALRYFDQKILDFNSEHVRYDHATSRYYPHDWVNTLGEFMILKSLSVREDGLCVGVFDRASIPQNFFADKDEETVKEDLLNGYYGLLDEVHTVTLIFREHRTEKEGYYLTIYSAMPKTN